MQIYRRMQSHDSFLGAREGERKGRGMQKREGKELGKEKICNLTLSYKEIKKIIHVG